MKGLGKALVTCGLCIALLGVTCKVQASCSNANCPTGGAGSCSGSFPDCDGACSGSYLCIGCQCQLRPIAEDKCNCTP